MFYRSWNAHTLSVTSMYLQDSMSSLRVWTASLDRHLCLHDVHAHHTCLRIPLPQAIESMVCTESGDTVFLGGAQGGIYAVNTNVVSANIHHSNIQLLSTNNARLMNKEDTDLAKGISVYPSLHGNHAIVQLVQVPGQPLLISMCASGKACWWDIFTRQCVKEVQVFPGAAITNCLVSLLVIYHLCSSYIIVYVKFL
jgi:hypothetical protein